MNSVTPTLPDMNASGGPFNGELVPFALPSAQDPPPPNADAVPLQRYTLAAVSAPDLAAREIVKPRSLLGDGILMAGGLSILYGKPGTGKTWLMLHQALCLVRGEPWLGLRTHPDGIRVGILELELRDFSVQQRLKALGVGTHERDSNLLIVARPDLKGAVDLLRADERAAFRQWIIDAKLDLVGVDAFSRAHTASERDEQEIGEVLSWFDALRHETHCAIGLNHHERKGASGQRGEEDDLDALRGHSRLQSDPTLLMRVLLKRGGRLRSLRFAKVSEGPTPEPIWFEQSSAGIELRDPPEQIGVDNRARVLAAVSAATGPITNAELQKLLGLKREAVRKHLKALCDEGQVKQFGTNREARFQLSPAEPADPAAQAGAAGLNQLLHA